MQNRNHSNQATNWGYLNFLQGFFYGANTPSAAASATASPLSAAAAAAVSSSPEEIVAASTLASISEEEKIMRSLETFAKHAAAQSESGFIQLNNRTPTNRGAFRDVIYNNLPLKEKARLAKTCHYFHTLFQPELTKRAARQLMLHIMHGNQEAAEKMLKANPALLLLPTSIDARDDYSGRSFENTTAFQAALRMQDVDMWQMIEEYFKQLPDGNAAKATQFYAEFPNGEPIAQQPYGLECLVNVITTSSDDAVQAQLRCEQNESILCQAFNIFRFDFTQCSLNEKHFNPQHLINALTVYNEQFDHWSWNQRDLFCRQVFGYMQRYVPACYAQAFAQGIYYITEEGEKLRRTFDYRDGGGRVYPLDSDPARRLGYEIYVTSGAAVGAGAARRGRWPLHVVLQNYVKQKHQPVANLSGECKTLNKGLKLRSA